MAVPRREFITQWNRLQDVDAMASHFGLKPKSIKDRLRVLRQDGLVRSNGTISQPTEEQEFINTWNAVRVGAKVARILGMTETAVRHKVRRLRAAGEDMAPSLSEENGDKRCNGSRTACVPTPEQIKKAAAAVRATWSERERRERGERVERIELDPVPTEVFGFRDNEGTI